MNRTQEVREQADHELIERLGKEKRWDELILEMDRQDEARQQREQYHEVPRSEISDIAHTGRRRYGKPKEYKQYVISNPNQTEWEDIIFDSPQEIDELVSDTVSILGLRRLTDSQKTALFYSVVRGVSTKYLAQLLGCGERNVIKHIKAGVKKFQKYAKKVLRKGDRRGLELTTTHRSFLEWLENPLTNEKVRQQMLADGTLEAWLKNYIPKSAAKEEYDGD